MSRSHFPPRDTKHLAAVAILRYHSGAEEVPAGGLRLPPVPVGPNLLASLRLQKPHGQYHAAGRARSPTERRSSGAWGPRGAGSRTLQAAGPGLIDSEPVDTVLRALVLELSLDCANEMPGL